MFRNLSRGGDQHLLPSLENAHSPPGTIEVQVPSPPYHVTQAVISPCHRTTSPFAMATLVSHAPRRSRCPYATAGAGPVGLSKNSPWTFRVTRAIEPGLVSCLRRTRCHRPEAPGAVPRPFCLPGSSAAGRRWFPHWSQTCIFRRDLLGNYRVPQVVHPSAVCPVICWAPVSLRSTWQAKVPPTSIVIRIY